MTEAPEEQDVRRTVAEARVVVDAVEAAFHHDAIAPHVPDHVVVDAEPAGLVVAPDAERVAG